MPWTSHNGVSLHYAVSGNGPAVVFLHELGGSLASWDGVVTRLPVGLRILRYDQRGAGLSEKVRQPFSLDDQVRDLAAIFDEVQMRDVLWLIAAAAGTLIALKFAEQYPKRIAGLICCAPAVDVDSDRRAYLLERSELASKYGMQQIVDVSLGRSFPKERIGDPAVYSNYRARFLANDPVAYSLANLSLAEAETDRLGERVTAPCLLIAGQHDAMRPPEQVQALAQRIPGARVDLLPAGHLMHVEDPAAVAGRILSFMQQNGMHLPASEPSASQVAGDVFVEANDLRFHCRVEGRKDAPWMVFSNSLATNLSVWDDVAAAFAGRFHILRYDQRGHGTTDIPREPCSFDILTEDAAALMKHFGVRDAIFCGVSMGAVTALCLAQRFPELLRAAIACDGQPSSPTGNEGVWEQRLQQARSAGMASLVEPTIERWFPRTFVANDGPRLDRVREMIRSTPTEGYIANAQALMAYDLRAGFAGIAVPTLLLAGSEDGGLPAAMRALHTTMPASSFVEIKGAGHLPNEQDPKAVIDAIEQFLANAPSAKREKP